MGKGDDLTRQAIRIRPSLLQLTDPTAVGGPICHVSRLGQGLANSQVLRRRMQVDEENWPRVDQHLFGAGQYAAFGAFHVDLYEFRRRVVVAVDKLVESAG